MTGFGRSEASDERHQVTVEVRCTNHRYLDLNLRTPRDLGRLEEPLRRMLKGPVKRGRVDVYLLVEDAPLAPGAVRLDVALTRGYLEALRSLCSDLGLPDRVGLDHLLRIPDLWRAPQAEPDHPADLDALVFSAAAKAISAMLEMREREGAALRADLELRLGRLEELRSAIAGRAGGLVSQWRDRLLARLAELLPGREAAVDPVRVEQEVAAYADRSDISEELVRWHSHLRQMAGAMEASDGQPIGRRLEFLCQETLREVNTVGSKALDSDIAHAVVAAKEELERMREQLHNIE